MRLNDIPPRRDWVFHLRPSCNVAGRTERRCYDVILPGGLCLKLKKTLYTSSHIFGRVTWDKVPVRIFQKFEIPRVKERPFQTFKKS